MIPTRARTSGFPEPADIVRFECETDPKEAAREIHTRAGLLEQLSDSDLRGLLNAAPRAPA